MKLTLFIFPRAEADLDAHFDWLAQDDPEIALAFDEAAFKTFDRLSKMPGLGAERNYFIPN